MKKKNIINLFNYVKMIFHIRNIKHELKNMANQAETIKTQAETIKNLKRTNEIMNKVWHKFVSDEKNKSTAIEAFKSLTCNSADTLLIQSYLKYLLKNFDEICRRNGIKYWFRGGSLLGVVRHGGFIPWGDDIDLGITRNDMYKLQEILEDTDFKIVYYFNDNLPENICRMPRFINAKNGIDIFIDLFPFDFTEEYEKDAVKTYWSKRRQLYDEIHPLVENNIIANYKGFMFEDNSKDLNLLNEIFDKYTIKDQVVSANMIYPFDWFDTTQNLYYKISDIFPLREMKFEDMDVYVPNDFILALNMCYDNFLDFPPQFVDHKDCHKLLANKRHIKKFLLREKTRANLH